MYLDHILITVISWQLRFQYKTYKTMIYRFNVLLSGVATCLEKEETRDCSPRFTPPPTPGREIRDATFKFKCSTMFEVQPLQWHDCYDRCVCV